ncbi:hypothetical protein [Frankia sp. Cr2]|uniref:hypothetical protein n=1 Tax=Frankia sp. Cr2 TaxID=3073932 RepID=UPI002AD2B05E|nr:hypothetical protein [Frankia sp. Cr2]
MMDARNAERQVARLARVRDEELNGLNSGTAARTLLASIVADQVHPCDPQPRRRLAGWQPRRLVLAAAAVIAMTVAGVVGLSLLQDGMGNATSYANSAIEVTRERDFFVARIKDPLADRDKYVEAFRAVGKDVRIELVPVSPRLVGQRLQASGGSGQMSSELVSSGPNPADCELKPASCTMVIRISAETTGTVRYTLGRAAQPGEAYWDPDIDAGMPPAPHEISGGSGR